VATGVSIADLFAAVKFPVDLASMRKAETQIQRFQRVTQRRLDNLRPPRMEIAKFGDAADRVMGKVAAFGLRWGKVGALAAGTGAALAAKDALDFDAALTDLAVSSGGAIGNIEAFRKKTLGVSTATGLAKEDVLGIAKSYVTLTGDSKTAADQLGSFARVAFGQKATAEDVAASAAAMAQQFGIAGDQFERGFSILSAQGKAGKVELRDIASLTASLGAAFKPFGKSQGVGGLATLGASFQVAARNFGDASEAATGLESLMASVQKHAENLRKKGGVKVFEEDGKTLKPLLQIVDEISSKNFSGEQLFKLLGRQEAVATFRALRDNRSEVDALTRSLENANDVQEDFNRRSASSSARTARAWNGFKNSISAAFTPERMEKIAAGAEFFFEHLLALAKVIKLAFEAVAGAIMDVGHAAAWVGKQVGGFISAPDQAPVLKELFKSKSDRDVAAAARGGDLTARAEVGRRGQERAQGALARAQPFTDATVTWAKVAAEKQAGGGGVTNNFTINATQMDPKQLAGEIDRRVGRTWDDKMREAAGP
jgi:hypothetical protein